MLMYKAKHARLVPDGHLSIDEQRLQWRKSLSPELVRTLAYDFRCGYIDQSTEDAMAEYQHRWPKVSSEEEEKAAKKARKAKKLAKRDSAA